MIYGCILGYASCISNTFWKRMMTILGPKCWPHMAFWVHILVQQTALRPFSKGSYFHVGKVKMTNGLIFWKLDLKIFNWIGNSPYKLLHPGRYACLKLDFMRVHISILLHRVQLGFVRRQSLVPKVSPNAPPILIIMFMWDGTSS